MSDSRRDGRPPRRDNEQRRGHGSAGPRKPAHGGKPHPSMSPKRGQGGEGEPQSGRGSRSDWQDRGGDRSGRSRDTRDSRDKRDPRGARSTEDASPRHDDPPIPEDVVARDLHPGARAELKTLTKENADEVARHLVMASRLIDEDPALAHRHSLAAQRRAGRVGVVRETVAITAYATGDFALAIRELRTYRRLTGSNDQLPLMVDSERGVGRPERALELGRSVDKTELEPGVQVALAIAMSGARLDLGQAEAALRELQIPQLDPDRAFSWSPALFDAYATVLEELGRDGEAEEWWRRADRAEIALEAAASDGDEIEVLEEEGDEVGVDLESDEEPGGAVS